MSETIIVAILSIMMGLCFKVRLFLMAVRLRIVAKCRHEIKLLSAQQLQLEKKVEKHNNVLERVYDLEKSEAVIKEEIKVANHRIDDLESNH